MSRNDASEEILSDFLASLDSQKAKLGTQSINHVKSDSSEPKRESSEPRVVEYVWSLPDAENDTDSLNSSTKASPEEKQYFVHKLTQADTIQGIVLRYGVEFSDIRQLNSMSTDRLTSFSELKIPKNPRRLPTNLTPKSVVSQATRETKLLSTFASIFPCIEEKEARYYLESYNWDFEQAVKACEEDCKWEKENKIQLEKSSKTLIKNNNGSSSKFPSDEEKYNQISTEASCGTFLTLFKKRNDGKQDELKTKLLDAKKNYDVIDAS